MLQLRHVWDEKTMRTQEGYFDSIHCTEAIFGPPRLDGGRLVIPVQMLPLFTSHPLFREDVEFEQGEFVFDGVVSSRHSILEHRGKSEAGLNQFAPAREIVDVETVDVGSAASDSEPVQTFEFEGSLSSPSAWISLWIVQAKSFTLRLE